ncbi:hypothetical protein CC1G_02188 [Coprinopsis cinerea okayama7|uniref:Uncharacterized protein n=1 Tax=Coprinopsis cinerea (strain Okayama-7 / 130 / ATCC MYA-4618 / FGSC 9003) TaxID=240176 RepID=A8NKH5_COPC7|nr:hypothetical protein CC1G_02188 [Coprinopsis cinerea okayama7\|eukprot:XP_001834452.2 hypothetical protein CC1G_02188 [Coprinopsis cinerea okayama7\
MSDSGTVATRSNGGELAHALPNDPEESPALNFRGSLVQGNANISGRDSYNAQNHGTINYNVNYNFPHVYGSPTSSQISSPTSVHTASSTRSASMHEASQSPTPNPPLHMNFDEDVTPVARELEEALTNAIKSFQANGLRRLSPNHSVARNGRVVKQ